MEYGGVRQIHLRRTASDRKRYTRVAPRKQHGTLESGLFKNTNLGQLTPVEAKFQSLTKFIQRVFLAFTYTWS